LNHAEAEQKEDCLQRKGKKITGVLGSLLLGRGKTSLRIGANSVRVVWEKGTYLVRIKLAASNERHLNRTYQHTVQQKKGKEKVQ